MKKENEILNVKQLAEYMGIGLNSTYRLTHQKDFPTLRVGKRILVSKEELDKWIECNSKMICNTDKENNYEK